jgi:hypothetical protein
MYPNIQSVYNETTWFYRTGCLKWNALDSGDVFMFFSCVKGFLHTTGVHIPSWISGYLTGNRWDAQTVLTYWLGHIFILYFLKIQQNQGFSLQRPWEINIRSTIILLKMPFLWMHQSRKRVYTDIKNQLLLQSIVIRVLIRHSVYNRYQRFGRTCSYPLPPKSCYLSTRIHGVTSSNIVISLFRTFNKPTICVPDHYFVCDDSWNCQLTAKETLLLSHPVAWQRRRGNV